MWIGLFHQIKHSTTTLGPGLHHPLVRQSCKSYYHRGASCFVYKCKVVPEFVPQGGLTLVDILLNSTWVIQFCGNILTVHLYNTEIHTSTPWLLYMLHRYCVFARYILWGCGDEKEVKLLPGYSCCRLQSKPQFPDCVQQSCCNVYSSISSVAKLSPLYECQKFET